ncbi:MAG: tryptophan--tRNA ligase [Spirochaetaceae bacterium]|nr:tryptophan--tRNA ligase [Spirochaetaceae bacterium]
MNKTVITGIKPTGEVHIGNYLGAIKPAIELAKKYKASYFVADYHALNTEHNAENLRRQSLNVAATWLACGLNPDEVIFYRQSDVPETFELNTILTNFTAKGLLNRAHAYKAAVDNNRANHEADDHHINMGLYSYPVLMAADILLFDSNLVPVGHDQQQHVEIAADIAQSINHLYGKELFTVPEPYLTPEGQTIVGLDGRKMSKSYNNVIPLFAESKRLKKIINSIKTNSQEVHEPKEPEGCTIFTLYRLFAGESEVAGLASRYRAGGMGWGEAKAALYEVIEREFAAKRELFNNYIQNPHLVETHLQQGAVKARSLATNKLKQLRKAIGID